MNRVWVNGTFDILHIGHIRLLQYASTFGLVRVGIDSDKRVKQKKGKNRPYNTLNHRIEFMQTIKYVNSVVSFNSDEELIFEIKLWKPDIIVIGTDYTTENIIGGEYVSHIKFFEKIDKFSTTNILNHEKT